MSYLAPRSVGDSCCSACSEGKPCGSGLGSFLDDIVDGVSGLFTGGSAPPVRGKPRSMQGLYAEDTTTENIMDYASAGYYIAKAKGYSQAADMYKSVYWSAAARGTQPASAEEIVGLKDADRTAAAEKQAAVSAAVSALPAPMTAGMGPSTTKKAQNFIEGNLTWLLPVLGIGIWVLWERNTKSGRQYARKNGKTRVISYKEAFGGGR